MSVDDETNTSLKGQEEAFKAWDLPYVQESNQADPNATNALNRKATWKYEPPEVEEEILPPTAEEIEAIRKAAHDEGFSQGHKEGHAQGSEIGVIKGHQEGFETGYEEGTSKGLTAGEEQSQQLLAKWTSLIDSLHNPVANLEEALEKELVLLAVSLAKGVIRSEVKTNSDLIFQALSEGLKALPIQEEYYQIHLHPNDIELVNNHFSAEEIAKHRWDFIEAPELSAGGCEIVTQSNAVDISIERRVKGVIDKFLLEQGLSQINDNDE